MDALEEVNRINGIQEQKIEELREKTQQLEERNATQIQRRLRTPIASSPVSMTFNQRSINAFFNVQLSSAQGDGDLHINDNRALQPEVD
jgi:hypothetical protein